MPSAYPDTWAFINTVYGVELIDTAAKAPDHVRGQLGAAPFPSLMPARSRPEVYVAESFYSRGTWGVRTDVVTIYDMRILAPTGEIVRATAAVAVRSMSSDSVPGERRCAT